MTCECQAAGFCATFGKQQSPRMHAICQRNAEGLTPEQCDTYRANWTAAAALKSDALACAHRGPQVDKRTQKVEKKGCGSCAKRGEEIPVYTCSLFGLCTIKPWQIGQKEATCLDCEARKSSAPAPIDRRRIDTAKMLPAEYQFNNSIIRFGERLLMAYRLHWSGARIVLAELDEQFRPVRNWKLPLTKGSSQEDPRLWIYRGQLHVSYSAVKSTGGAIATDVCYARLEPNGNDWRVAEEFAPVYEHRDHWEKNWGFFEHGGELLCLYSIKMGDTPFRILRVDGERTELVAEHNCAFGHKAGMLHGGAPPVLHQGEYYCWYHRRLGATSDKVYSIDLMTFEARYPFRPARHIPAPLLLPAKSDRPGPKVPHAVFPGGAYLERNAWNVSFGYYDKWSELARWDFNHIEDALQPLPGGPFDGLAYTPADAGLRVWKQVAVGNEYRLPDDMTGQIVVDVGGHIGSFASACLERGAAQVTSCEPMASSRAFAERNLARFNGRSSIVPAYIVGTEEQTLADHYGGTLHADPTASVRTLASVLAELPRVDLLKLDCEGPEHAIAEHTDLSGIPRIVGECHRINGRGIDSLVAALERQGFAVEYDRQGDGLWNFWATRKA
jgi:FkbM family methyltransferase